MFENHLRKLDWDSQPRQELRRSFDGPFNALSRRMHRLFDELLPGFELAPFASGSAALESFIPRMNVTEDEKEICITAELPGMDEKDIELTLSNDRLTIKGEKKEEVEEKDKDHYRMERSYGSFERWLPLPEHVDQDKIQAHFKNGLLKISLPKTPESQKTHKRIEVKSD